MLTTLGLIVLALFLLLILALLGRVLFHCLFESNDIFSFFAAMWTMDAIGNLLTLLGEVLGEIVSGLGKD